MFVIFVKKKEQRGPRLWTYRYFHKRLDQESASVLVLSVSIKHFSRCRFIVQTATVLCVSNNSLNLSDTSCTAAVFFIFILRVSSIIGLIILTLLTGGLAQQQQQQQQQKQNKIKAKQNKQTKNGLLVELASS